MNIYNLEMYLNKSAFISVSQIERKIMKYFKSMAIIVDAFSDFFFGICPVDFTIRMLQCPGARSEFFQFMATLLHRLEQQCGLGLMVVRRAGGSYYLWQSYIFF